MEFFIKHAKLNFVERKKWADLPPAQIFNSFKNYFGVVISTPTPIFLLFHQLLLVFRVSTVYHCNFLEIRHAINIELEIDKIALMNIGYRKNKPWNLMIFHIKIIFYQGNTC